MKYYYYDNGNEFEFDSELAMNYWSEGEFNDEEMDGHWIGFRAMDNNLEVVGEL